jgi:hypothetical protein
MVNVLSALIPALLGVLGFWIAFYPPTTRNRKWFLVGIVVLTTISAILAYNGASVLDVIVRNTSEPASFSMLDPDQVFPLAVGQKCVFNISYKNGGSISTIGTGKIRDSVFLDRGPKLRGSNKRFYEISKIIGKRHRSTST